MHPLTNTVAFTASIFPTPSTISSMREAARGRQPAAAKPPCTWCMLRTRYQVFVIPLQFLNDAPCGSSSINSTGNSSSSSSSGSSISSSSSSNSSSVNSSSSSFRVAVVRAFNVDANDSLSRSTRSINSSSSSSVRVLYRTQR